MIPVRIEGALDRPLGAPSDWSEEKHGHCGGLFIRPEEINGIAYMRSAWEVDASEAGLLFAGAKLTLGVAGHCHPVVQLDVGPLPPDFEPVVTARRFTAPDAKACVRVEMLFPHGGGRRGFCNTVVDISLGAAIALCVEQIEAMARREGWTP